MVLENKLGIEDEAELAREQERITKKKTVELFDSGEMDNLLAGTMGALSEIHRCMFEDVYVLAGQLRNTNIVSDEVAWAPLMFLPNAMRGVDMMPSGTFEQIVEKYVEINLAHPFITGNGRAMRLWMDNMMGTMLGKVIDWTQISKEDYMAAIKKSPEGDGQLKELLRGALLEKVGDRDLFLACLDQSYAYDGYEEFKAAEL